MRRLWILLALVPGLATAQAAERQTAIESAMLNRMSVQNDFWYDDGDFPRVIQLLTFASELAPHDYEIATNLGWMLGNIEEYGAELAVYARYRRDNPNDPDGSFPEANFYFKRKAYSKVPTLLEPTLKMKPHPNSYRILAHAYDRMGMFKDCVRVWTDYLKVNPNDPQAKNNLAKAQKKLSGR